MFKIITDSACDLHHAVFAQHDIDVVPLHVFVAGQEIHIDTDNDTEMHRFYQELGAGNTATTSQVSVGEFMVAFQPYVTNHVPVLYLAFDGALSGTYNSAIQARKLLLEDDPNAAITIVDSRAASCGLGMMLLDVIKKRDAGRTPAEIATWVVTHRNEYRHIVTIDDLHYLVAGGRLKANAARIGTLLNLHPILVLQPDGQIVVKQKVRTFSKAIHYLADQTTAALNEDGTPRVMVASSATDDVTAALVQAIKAVMPTAQITTLPVGTVLASHTGPGCCAVFFRSTTSPE